MTIQQALEAFKDMFPDRAEWLQAEEAHTIGYQLGPMNGYALWDCGPVEGCTISNGHMVSTESFEDALSQARATKQAAEEEV